MRFEGLVLIIFSSRPKKTCILFIMSAVYVEFLSARLVLDMNTH